MRFGYALAAFALLILFGVSDLLPVDLLPWLWGLWSGETSTSHHAYMRVVPYESSNILPWVLLIAGVSAIAVGWALRARSQAK